MAKNEKAIVQVIAKENDTTAVNTLVLIDPSVRCKVSHFIYNCFFYNQGMRLNTSYKACYRTVVAARA